MVHRHRSRRIAAALSTVVLAGVVGSPSLALACGLDGKPSMSMNGALVHLNKDIPTTQAQALRWAPFIAASHYHRGATIAMTENRIELARTLVPAAMTRPWRWQFGDGTTAYGWTVRHTYKHAGSWRVTTDAYDPAARTWDNFDQAVIVVKS